MKRCFRSAEARDMSLSLACMKRVMLAWSGADTEDNRGRDTSALLVSGCNDRVSIYQYVIGICPVSVEADMLGLANRNRCLGPQSNAVDSLTHPRSYEAENKMIAK